MSGVTIDASQVRTFAGRLAAAQALMTADAVKVVKRGALNVKRQMVADTTGHPHSPAFPSSISYDVTVAGGTIDAEIGPDKDRPQGALGNLLAFGSANNAPIFDINAGLRAEEPRFVAALGKFGEAHLV